MQPERWVYSAEGVNNWLHIDWVGEGYYVWNVIRSVWQRAALQSLERGSGYICESYVTQGSVVQVL